MNDLKPQRETKDENDQPYRSQPEPFQFQESNIPAEGEDQNFQAFNFQQPMEPAAETQDTPGLSPVAVPIATKPSSKFSDLSVNNDQTGNFSSGSLTDNEPFVVYDLVLEGLDLKSTWEPIKEVLLDPRLKLDVGSLEKRIRGGKLIMEKLSPLIVHYIVQRIKSYNVTIHWKFHDK
ncbi:MAG: hypothetical protein V4736_09040 [Bdellovibrionota bacterium]